MVRLDDSYGQALLALIEGSGQVGLIPLDLGSLMQTIKETIEGQLREGASRKAGDVIDLVAELVMRPDAMNALTPRVLMKLRGMLLTDREKTAVSELVEGGRQCGMCQRSILDGTAVVWDGLRYLCTVCSPPHAVSCPSCREGSIPITPGFRSKMRSGTCKGCKQDGGNGGERDDGEEMDRDQPPPPPGMRMADFINAPNALANMLMDERGAHPHPGPAGNAARPPVDPRDIRFRGAPIGIDVEVPQRGILFRNPDQFPHNAMWRWEQDQPAQPPVEPVELPDLDDDEED